MALLADRVQAMRPIWTDDEAEHHGEFVDFAPIWSWPMPVQRPHPPVLVGGNGPGTEDRAAFAEAGVDRCLLMLGPDDPSGMLTKLDEWAAFLG